MIHGTSCLGGADPRHRALGRYCPQHSGHRVRHGAGCHHAQLWLVLPVGSAGAGGDGADPGVQPLWRPETGPGG